MLNSTTLFSSVATLHTSHLSTTEGAGNLSRSMQGTIITMHMTAGPRVDFYAPQHVFVLAQLPFHVLAMKAEICLHTNTALRGLQPNCTSFLVLEVSVYIKSYI